LRKVGGFPREAGSAEVVRISARHGRNAAVAASGERRNAREVERLKRRPHDLLATCRTLAEAGQTILVVEQNISAAMSLADRIYVLNNGHMVEELAAADVRAKPEVPHRHLGV
jgi:ABC-type branched-subunit amino acid transport system ATPase component